MVAKRGALHPTKSFLGCIGFIMTDSGMDNIVIADLVCPRSLRIIRAAQ